MFFPRHGTGSQWQTKPRTSHRLVLLQENPPEPWSRSDLVVWCPNSGARTKADACFPELSLAFQRCSLALGKVHRFWVGGVSPHEFRPCTFCQDGYVESPVAGRIPRFPLSPGCVAGAPLAAVYSSREWRFRGYLLFPPDFTLVEASLKSNRTV